MIALAVDDEKPMLDALVRAVKASEDITEVAAFGSCSAVLEWAKENAADLAFLDISMRGMNGLVLAEKLQELQPECRIIFCTGYSEYAVDAFALHASGYLIKPVTAEAVQKEIDHIKGQSVGKSLLTVKCFGNFEVFCNGEVLSFKRTKTKEVLAFLVDRNGAGVSTREICAKLWENDVNDGKNRNYLYQMLEDLRTSLKEAGAESVMVKANGTYAVDTKRIDCDYYRFLETGKPEFYGEYMSQYSWAEETSARLYMKMKQGW